jgi:opacity protein-like surface antigen
MQNPRRSQMFKKMLFLVVLLVCVPGTLQAQDGFYVAAQAGFTQPSADFQYELLYVPSSIQELSGSSAFSWGLKAGHTGLDLPGPFYLGAEAELFRGTRTLSQFGYLNIGDPCRPIFGIQACSLEYAPRVKTTNLALSALLSARLFRRFQPYVGVGPVLTWARLELDDELVTEYGSELTMQFLAGLKVFMSPRFAVFVDYQRLSADYTLELPGDMITGGDLDVKASHYGFGFAWYF